MAGRMMWGSRLWQGNEAIAVHAEHGDPTGHFFGLAIRALPVEGLADQARELTAMVLGVLRDQLPDVGDLWRGEETAAVARRSVQRFGGRIHPDDGRGACAG